MRSCAMARSWSAFSARVMWAYSQQVTDREREVRAVQRIEVKLLDAFVAQAAAEIARDGGGDHTPCLDVLFQSLEHLGQPRRHLGTAQARHLGDALEVRDRNDAGHDRHRDAALGGMVAEAQEIVGIEEELRDAAVGAGIDLALEIIEIALDALRVRMLLGVARDADQKVADLLEASHE